MAEASMAAPDLDAVGLEILNTSRNQLYIAMPYLDEALCALLPLPGGEITVTAATNGEQLYYSGAYLADLFMRSSTLCSRLYLHMILHCILRHLSKKKGRDAVLWDLACDAAVESILDDLPCPCVKANPNPARQKFYGECLCSLKVLTAEGIYRVLLKEKRSEFELARLQRAFLMDDHGLWCMDGQDSSQSADNDSKWKVIASRVQTGMETALTQQANGGEAVLEQVRISARNDVDYRAFLRRFAAPREVIRSDHDAFDYIYYTFGLIHYGNMPLIEPPETREEKRIEDLVLAIDTSMSTSGELVREFLRCTYSILRSAETFTQRLNIHIIQCDDTVRSDVVIHSMEQLRKYMDDVSLTGGSATDFRPVFEHISALQKEGQFSSLRGLIYFTDGMGIYPSQRPDYETAFVLLEEPPINYKMPAWAIRIVLDSPALDRSALSLEDDWEDAAEEMPQL